MKALIAAATIAVLAFAGFGCGDNGDHKVRYRDNDSSYRDTARHDYDKDLGHRGEKDRPLAEGFYRDYYRGGFEPRRIEREGWVLLGSQTVDFKREGDTIMVQRGDRFRQLRLVVDGAPIELYTMNVYFRDGDKFSAIDRVFFRENSQTRAIDLPGRTRDIRKVTFLYRSVDKREGKATIYLFGR